MAGEAFSYDSLVDLALERLLAIQWSEPFLDTVDKEGEKVRSQSHGMLFNEYFRRMLLWHQSLFPDQQMSRDFDLPAALAPMPESICEIIETILYPAYGNGSSTELRMSSRYLHWVSLLSIPAVQTSTLPCPYEPVIRLYERGSSFYFHHGWIYMLLNGPTGGDTSWSLYPPEVYLQLPPLLRLDDESLDEAARIQTAQYEGWTKYKHEAERATWRQ